MRVYVTGCCQVGYYIEGEWVSHCPKCGSYNPKMIIEEKELTYFDVSGTNEYPKKYITEEEE
tara:strand:- start:234 stop:419 length:186 start_codon:yes stop_codon:yes gene_type:complete